MSSHPDYAAPYELSNGHPIECPPSGPLDGSSNLVGGQVLDTDPDVEWAGVEAGYSPSSGTLRAAEVALDRPPADDGHGWIPGVPRLAVEYADAGKDEVQLQRKIAEFFAHGSELIRGVRLLGPRRVEVYRPDGAFEVKTVGEELTVPGILRNPVPADTWIGEHSMATLSVELSEDVLLASGYSREDFLREAKFLLVAKLFELGRLSAGKAAELCAMTRVEFMLAMGRAGIPVADLDDAELEREFADV